MGPEGIGDLHDPPYHSEAFGASFNGDVFVGFSSIVVGPEIYREAVMWNAQGNLTSLGALEGHVQAGLVEARVVSDDGSIIAGFSHSPEGLQAFRWTAADGMVGLGDLDGGEFHSRIYGMSADGAVLSGWASTAAGSVAAKWTQDEGFVLLGDLPGGLHSSWAKAVSADGKVIVGSALTTEGERAFRWTEVEGMTAIESGPDGVFSVASDVSENGSVVVGTIETIDGPEAGIWDAVRGVRPLKHVLVHDLGLYGLNEEMEPLGGRLSIVRALSRDGSVVVGNSWVADLRGTFVPGDANFDGHVDLADFATLKANFGFGKYFDQGDFTSDGRVDLDDFAILKASFGTAAVVPEPAGNSLAILALPTILLGRHISTRRTGGRQQRSHGASPP